MQIVFVIQIERVSARIWISFANLVVKFLQLFQGICIQSSHTFRLSDTYIKSNITQFKFSHASHTHVTLTKHGALDR